MTKETESKKALINLYNTLPDGVIVLNMLNIPMETEIYREYKEEPQGIVTGDVGAKHYELLYCNR
jgi:hypothetical protein